MAIAPLDRQLLDALRDVEDPELPISIVDMGLIVELRRGGNVAELKVTFTSMGCPAMEMIVEDIRARLLREPGIEEVRIDIVWDPIWTPARLSEDGKAALREWGIAV